MKTTDFDYFLPNEQIAQTPLEPRDSSRMLVYSHSTKEVEHKHFYNIADYLMFGDVLVLNETRVLPARLYGCKPGGARVEVLLHKRKSLKEWEVLLKPGKRAKPGTVLVFSDELSGEVVGTAEDILRSIRFSYDGVFEDILAKIGEMPLPHYITKRLENQERYQTVYSKTAGSSAAPTAGLHFTPELLDKIEQKGITILKVLLHVGLGTFRPVKMDDIEQHEMHSEYYEVTAETAKIYNAEKKRGARIIAVGTTSARVLESVSDTDGMIAAGEGETSIFIYPPYRFKTVDGLITNFHLPKSTLIMLVSAFIGREQALNIYNNAVSLGYRFFSFGDAMLLL